MRGNETLAVSVHPQRARNPAPSSHRSPLRTAARLRWRLAWPRGVKDWSCLFPLARCNLDLGSGSGAGRLEGDLTPVQVGAGRSGPQPPAVRCGRRVASPGGGEQLINSLSITNHVAGLRVLSGQKHRWNGNRSSSPRRRVWCPAIGRPRAAHNPRAWVGAR